MSTTAPEHARRRTFAIISHPDAGKTTLTETLLLAGGAIRAAGEVAARGEARRTRSDWMKIERERGISVSASVMTFERGDTVFNLLDTPGHEDFSEDTYRTLTAADSAIMVLDAAKGIEPRTLKLFEICRLRDIPIITFVNKMDREARDPLELLDEVQAKLALDTSPLFWPAASGERFGGMLDLADDRFVPFVRPAAGDAWSFSFDRIGLDEAGLSASVREEMMEGAELARAAYPAFDMESYRAGALTPVVFGSALRRFGVVQLLDAIESLAPSPRPQKGEDKAGVRMINPDEGEVSGFVFKIQANMDPNHRDRIAFLRLCSGTFRRGMRLKTSAGKPMTVSAPMMFMAQDREIADTAYPGDVIGIPNHGALRVGDSLSETGLIRYSGVPNFAPEILRRVILKDPMKAKHMRRALESLAEEGVTQLFKPRLGSDMIVGAVGPLQFDVLVERIAAEYGLEAAFETASYQAARWVAADDRAVLEAFGEKHMASMAEDVDDAPVFLGKNAWEIGYVQEKNPGVRFTATRERLG